MFDWAPQAKDASYSVHQGQFSVSADQVLEEMEKHDGFDKDEVMSLTCSSASDLSFSLWGPFPFCFQFLVSFPLPFSALFI